jgi:hypothetical protein
METEIFAILFSGGIFLMAFLNYVKPPTPPTPPTVVVQLGSEVEQPKPKTNSVN